MKKFIKPQKGLRVRRPDNGRVLSDAGEWVNWGKYWMRRAKDGSVAEAKPPRKKPAAAKQAETNGKEG